MTQQSPLFCWLYTLLLSSPLPSPLTFHTRLQVIVCPTIFMWLYGSTVYFFLVCSAKERDFCLTFTCPAHLSLSCFMRSAATTRYTTLFRLGRLPRTDWSGMMPISSSICRPA